jgi:mono/diheme cytochrome c family protein
VRPARLTALLASVWATAAWSAAAGAGIAPEPARSVWDGVYAKEQADRGESLYRDECSRCHPQGPSTGATFMTLWKGRTADDLFQQIKSTMPQDGPGRLTRRNYADLVAYILRVNGFPAGAALKPDPDALQVIRIEPKDGSTQVHP